MLFGSRLNRLATSIRRALSEYGVLGKSPPFVSDFINNKYLTGGNSSTFASAITHARSGNAVMTDGYGPELITNGGFDSDLSGWTDTNSHWSVVDGRAYHASSSTYNPLSLTLSLSGTYILTFDAEVISASNTAHLLVDGTSTQLLANGSDSYSVFITDATTIVFSREPGSTAEFYIDNVSVREMPVLKWAPHNLLTYSAFDSATPTNWSVGFGTGTYNHTLGSEISNLPTITQEQTASGRSYLTQNVTLKANTTYTLKVLVDESLSSITDGNNKILSANISGASGTLSASIDDVSDGKVEITFTTGSTTSGTVRVGIGVLNNAVGTVVFAAPHLYRSDLGGMAGNPDQPPSRASYVPTTSSAVYLPRVGHHVYNGSAWVNEGLLAESESRTNLAPQSDMSTATVVGGTRTANAAVSPDGTENAFKLEANTDGGNYIAVTNILTAGESYAVSVYAKAGNNDIIRIANVSSGSSAQWFDLTNGTLLTSNGTDNTATIQDVGNGWYRCTRYFDSATTGSNTELFIGNSRADDTTGSTDGDYVYLYGFQIENNATSSSFIPTSGSSVTRAAETFTIPSANLPWPEPNYIGSELVTNGTFDTDSNWTLGTGMSITGGELVLAASPSGQYARSDGFTIDTSKVYILTLDVTGFTSGTVSVRISKDDDSSELILGTLNAAGSYSFPFVYTLGTSIQVNVRSLGGTTLDIDNVSVREIDPLSVSIAMDGRVTYADTDAGAEARLIQWSADSDNRLRIHLNTSTGGRTGRIDNVHKSGGTQTTVASDETSYSPDVLVPFNVAVRNLSNAINVGVDGVAYTENTSVVSLPDLSSSDLTIGHIYMGTIGTFRVWDKDLGDDGIVEATNPSLEPSLSLTFEGTGTNSFVVNNWSE